MMPPIFSVVIPTYNNSQMLKAALASVLQQSFQDYEIIVIDDGSTDGTRGVMESFKDSRLRYYFQDNSGLPAIARNNGIKYSKGRYAAFLDGDDIWYPEKLKKCYEIFEQHPEACLVCHNELIRDKSGDIKGYSSYGPYAPEMFRRLLYKGNCLSPSATVVKRNALFDVGLFNERRDFFAVEDYDLWLKLSQKYNFYFLNEILGEYTLHSKNISSDIWNQRNSEIRVVKQNFKEYRKKSFFDFLQIVIRLVKIYISMAKLLFKNIL